MNAPASLVLRHKRLLAITAMIAILVLALLALRHLTATISVASATRALGEIPLAHVAAALGLTALSYFALTLYDVLALRTIGRPLPWRTAALASFTSYTLSHNLGFALLTGGAARYRIYRAAGIEAPDIARIVLIASLNFWVGVIFVAGVALLEPFEPLHLGAGSLPGGATLALGCAGLAFVLGFLGLAARGPRVLRLHGWTIPVPSLSGALAQLFVGAFDLAAASAALLVLVPGADLALLPTLVLAYALAILLSLVSHVPGGVGVFEATVLALVPGDRATLLAALIAYRLIYYLLPLALGIALLVWREGRLWQGWPVLVMRGARMIAGALAPMLVSLAVFGGGAILVLTGSLPALPERLAGLRDLVPLPVTEIAHLAASLVGAALLLVAPGLYRRLDGAFIAARILLMAGAIFAIGRGIDLEEATILLVILAVLQWNRRAFFRRTALTTSPMTPLWLIAVATVMGLAVWSGFYAFRHIPYSDALWWNFAWSDNASRFLRASFAAAVLLSGAIVWRLLAPARIRRVGETLDAETLARALAAATRTDALLALVGDKRFLVSDSRDAFLMYQVHGNSWIVMGDPVGPPESWGPLLWKIRAMAYEAQGRLMLYQISRDMLPLAIELGLSISKYGEEALVPLDRFSLDGGRMRSVRQAERRAGRSGTTFEIMPACELALHMSELQQVSDEWLANKGRREKAFSVGPFHADYLANFDFALVRHEGQIVAFANIWATPNREELSLDLMRHSDSAPCGTMEFLFAHLMLWGKEQGYRRFSLGLAPLSGIEARQLAPLWAKTAALLFSHGERYYGFRGLRMYKDKFAPIWEPRYVAGPGGLALARGLAHVSALIGNPGPAMRASSVA